jgi:hypothetical protein
LNREFDYLCFIVKRERAALGRFLRRVQEGENRARGKKKRNEKRIMSALYTLQSAERGEKKKEDDIKHT